MEHEQGIAAADQPKTTTTKKKRRRVVKKKHLSGYKRRNNTRDLAFSLEHIVAKGYQLQHDSERRREFRRCQEAVLEQQHCQPWVYFPEDENSDKEDDDDDHDVYNQNFAWQSFTEEQQQQQQQQSVGENSAAPSGKTGKRRKQIHKEDFRIYGDVAVGKEGFAKPPWPKQRKKQGPQDNRRMNNSDKNWEIEHGDSIHPLAFAATRLSQKIISTSAAQDQSLNGGNLNVSTTDTSLQEDQVPRALLLRCWERAVHASSQLIPVSVSNVANVNPDASTTIGSIPATNVRESRLEERGVTSTTLFGSNLLGLGDATTPDALIIPPLPPVKESSFLAYQRSIARYRWDTEQKCKSLGLGIPRKIINLTCRSCCQTFPTSKLVRDHYFGGGNQQGCCWNRIADKQNEVIAQVLDSHVKSQINEFLGLVMEGASERVIAPVNGRTQGKRRRHMNWHDILKFAEKAIHTSHPIHTSNNHDGDESATDPPQQHATHPVLETLQRKSQSYPLCLNPTVLETVRQRLVDRYAKLPF